MGQFAGDTDLQVIPGQACRWKEISSFSYTTDAGEIITVEIGLITDLASTPRIVWNIYPPFGLYERSAIVHDELYTKQPWGPSAAARKKSDDILLEAMKADQVSWITRHIIWSQVRMWGWVAWDQHTKEIIKAQGGQNGGN